jgi:type I restriction enzyme S subunit
VIENQELSDLPIGWVWATLGDVCTSPQYGWTTSASTHGKLHLLRTTDITQGKVNWSSVPFCKKEPIDVEKYLLNDGDILISRAGSVGYSYLVKNPEKAVFASYLIRFRPFIDGSYLSYFLKSPSYWALISEKSIGIAVSNVNASKLKQIPLPLAPLPEQRRIVGKVEVLFSFLDAGVASLRKVQAQLKRYRQAVLKYAFEGKLTEEWRKTHKDQIETAQVLFQKIEKKRISRNPLWKNTEPINSKDLPEIPDDWVWVRAQEVCENITNGYTPSATELHKSKGEIPFIKINNLTFTGKLDFSKNSTFIDRKVHETMLKRSKVFPGDVLINIVGPPLGKVSIVPNLYPEWNINQAIVFYRPIEGYNRDFLALCMQTRTLTSYLTNQAKATAGQFNISVNMSRNLPIPLPPKEEQKEIVLEVMKHLDAMESAETALNHALSRADYLRNSILRTAFLGKLVPQDQNDEPAEKLLERIKSERAKRKPVGSAGSHSKKSKIDEQMELSRYVK